MLCEGRGRLEMFNIEKLREKLLFCLREGKYLKKKYYILCVDTDKNGNLAVSKTS